MRSNFKRVFFVVGALWILALWLMFSAYGAVQFWDRHVVKWMYGGTVAESIILGIIALSVFWILFIFKTIKDELDENSDTGKAVADQ